MVSFPAPRWTGFAVGVLILAAALGLYAYPLCWPIIMYDDFPILMRSWTWAETWKNVWLPNNEHAMPLGRLSTWLLVEAAGGRLTHVPRLVDLQGPLALLVAMVLVYLFVRRELGYPWYGLLAMAFFGISTVYQQAVYWFAASFSILALDMALLALLAAQAWRRTERLHYLAWVVVCCMLAPAWFASGVLAGPLCCLYLLPDLGIERHGPVTSRVRRRILAALAPLAGTSLFLAISLPRTHEAIMHAAHYGEKTALEAFNLKTGVLYTARSLVDNLFLGIFGVGGVTLPIAVSLIILPLLIAAATWWWRKATNRRLLLLGLGMILSHYILFYSARSPPRWLYDGVMTNPGWSRYHLVPQLGLTLFLLGGLPRWQGRLRLRPDGRLTWKQAGSFVLLAVLLAAIHLPRGLMVHWWFTPLPDGLSIEWFRPMRRLEQQDSFRQIEEIDELCRRHAIKAETAREVLGELHMRLDVEEENDWQFLRGADPSESRAFKSVEEARRILLQEIE